MRSLITAITLLLFTFTAIGIACLVIFFPLGNPMRLSDYRDVIATQSPKGTIYCGSPQPQRTLFVMNLFLRQEGVGFAGECRSGMRIVVPATQVSQWITTNAVVEESINEANRQTVQYYTVGNRTYTVELGPANDKYWIYTILVNTTL